MSSITLDDLNPAQRDAVRAPDGPILILAGAGSGKTRVLTYRIVHLLIERRAAPEQTLAVTFTNKAAGEMRERIGAMMGEGDRLPWVSTFHAFCARVLRQEAELLGYTRNFTIIDESDTLTTVRHLVDEVHLADLPQPEVVRARIDQAKNEAMFPEQLADAAASAYDRSIAELYGLYQQRLREMNSMDFGDLILLVHRMFETDHQALMRWQRRAAHLLVDEYQDTNRAQYLLVRALSAASGNLCVVGDEDQSIYRWRGADIRNILDFERDFPRAQIFKLEQNYRSSKTILAAAGAVIQNNRERKPKRLWTENARGELVTYCTGLTERDEADYIGREIARLIDGGMRPADIVVFYRVNAQSRVLEEALVRRRLPYYIVGGQRFYDQREIKDLVAYLRVIANPADALSLERAIGVPPRGIGAKTLEIISELAARNQVAMFEAMGRLETESRVALRSAKQASSLYSWMRELMGQAESIPVRALLDQIVTRSGIESYLANLPDGKTRQQNLAEMLTAASAFDAEYGAGGLAEFLERIALVNDADQLTSAGGRITLMTLHTSKGLEYSVAFIAGMEEGLFPHMRPQDSTHEVEEERRLCYVGMTRARTLLYLTNALSRELYGNRQDTVPSRFLGEIDQALIRRIEPEKSPTNLRTPVREPYIDYSDSQLPEADVAPASLNVGARIYHPTFGRGIIKRREGRGDAAKVWITFERGGLKLLVLKFANLRAIAD
jgi:DNA helicase II / ATP-dependent DNA helicase PcrA